MKWSRQADAAISKVPFFVRKKVKKRVEAWVAQKNKRVVDLADVEALKKKFLSKGGMEKEVKGYEVTTCFGGSGCPRAANSATGLVKEIETLFERADILGFLKETVQGDLKFHHEFRVAIADCPNACSRPQIVDIGIIGSVVPGVSGENCTLCGACAACCNENAIVLDSEKGVPVIDPGPCLACGRCIRACPEGTLVEGQKGFRVMLGGRLGRHPRLAMEIPGCHTHDEVLQLVDNSIRFYKKNSRNGQRFSRLLSSVDQVMDI